ncbi:acyltransferase family protein [Microbacterium sp. M3]|uniref:Acyltransferase family protein n=1 Tax=Microbacterium arthrosphaerae TaxID=792652 RepID=A0ABU4GWY3_9MICO|nr:MULTISPECIES: acyltransferase family protein [Microbacterium]MDW4571587.1 acyltransferase family protein [Microbacterium arthrosphaerae]MDW7605442.1 acyltransferase family protein [Microbacterium sp. M3]
MVDRARAQPDHSGFRADIQGLRAIAVGAVLLYHAGVPFLPGGYVGVDVFFVISGFLITSHLLDQLQRHGRLRFGEFYARRVRRILPASFVVLVLSLVAALIWYPPLLMRDVWAGAVATALYVPNYFFAAADSDYLAESSNPSLFQHYWSLGVEEQFYLLWPALLALVWVLVRSRRALTVVLAGVVAGSFALCVWLTFTAQPWAFFSLPSRAWELGIGGIVAVVLQHRARAVPERWAPAVGWLGIAAVAASVVFFSSETLFPGAAAALPVLGTAAVIAAGRTRGGPTAMLSVRAMTFLGLISYSLYLVHWPAMVLPAAAVPGPLPLWATLLIAVACVPVAWLLYRFVEDPVRRAPLLTRRRARVTLIGAVAGSLACLGVASAAYAVADSRSLHVERAASGTVIVDSPRGTDFVPDNLAPALRDARDSLPELYDDGCMLGIASTDPEGCVYGDPAAPRIVLFGDSHAAQWFPALEGFATAAGYSLEVHTKSSCPATDIETLRRGAPYPQCATWRDAVIERLNDDPPALVVLGTFTDPQLAPGVEDDARTWDAALGRTIDALSAPVAVIADTPDMHEDPAPCLSAHLSEAEVCAKPRADALAGPAREAERTATGERGIPLIDLNDYLCDDEVCPAIIGSTLVYRDSHHLTAAISADMARVMGEALRPLLPAAGG